MPYYMNPVFDEFSTYLTYEDIETYIDELFENGIEDEIEIHDKCIEKFGKYFYTIPLYLD